MKKIINLYNKLPDKNTQDSFYSHLPISMNSFQLTIIHLSSGQLKGITTNSHLVFHINYFQKLCHKNPPQNRHE
jgi:hypothetical protein